MGTHPIFESDFDCLTEREKMQLSRVNRLRALVTSAKKTAAQVEQIDAAQLPTVSTVRGQEGDASVLVDVKYSTVNYKDALVVTGNYAGLKFPMVGGVDLTGTVVSDDSGKLAPGAEIVLNSFGVGTDHWGGYCQQARVRPEWCLPLPSGMDHLTCARIGTAGYTAALCVQALIDAGIKPEDGAIIVSGATGGVGSVSVALLSSMGYDVVAMSGKVDNPMLTKLGAGKVVARADFEEKARALNRENYAGAVDVAGGNILANILSMTKCQGTVAACGLASSMNLPTTVAPFILRGVTLRGIDCVFQPLEPRVAAYALLAKHLTTEQLDLIGQNEIIGLEALPELGAQMLAGNISGRYVVDPSL